MRLRDAMAAAQASKTDSDQWNELHKMLAGWLTVDPAMNADDWDL
jgi:hypothetical protein